MLIVPSLLDFTNLKKEAWNDSNWKGEFFTQLWELREDLELMRYRLELNLSVINRLAHVKEKELESRIAETGTAHPQSEAVRLQARLRQVGCDVEEWNKLVQMNDYAFKLMTRTSETYVQTVGAANTQFANDQAQNSRKLTGYAL
jgi:hypothetical protein